MSRKLMILTTLTSAVALAGCASTGSHMNAETSASSDTASTMPAKHMKHMRTPKATPTPTAKMVGGAEMLPSDNIVENASKANNLTTLVSLVKAAGLADTLSGPGPFTVFAPTNTAFNRLPPGTLDTLKEPQNQEALKTILTYHVVPGKITAAELKKRIKAGGGKAMLTTVAGQPLTATLTNGNITLTSDTGAVAYVTPGMADVMQSNGVVHVVNGVLVPQLNAGANAGTSSSDTNGSTGQ